MSQKYIRETSASWCERSSVRTMQPVLIEQEHPFDWRFPVEMKPLLRHPAVTALPEESYRFLCVQYFYKYLNDVCLTETDVVNQVSRSIAYNCSAVKFPPELVVEALPIIIDESFHSYAARLFALEIEESTGITPIELPRQNQLVKALVEAREMSAANLIALAELLCCSISESTFTMEILEASRLQGYDTRFNRLMIEHLRDEGRHCNYFKRVLTYCLEHISHIERLAAWELIPLILGTYFDNSIDQEFDQRILAMVDMAELQRNSVLVDIGRDVGPWTNSPRCKNAISFLKSCGATVKM